MNKKTLKALKGSIEKWEKIVAGEGIDLGTVNCPLCQIFVVPKDSCEGCPVMEKTGESDCYGSPYYDHRPDSAQDELDFLESLLPEGKP